MDTVTHALLPVIIAGLAKQKTERFGRWAFVGIGFAGALPDLLNPHLSLEARMASWSHGVPFWLAISILWIVIAVSSRGRFTIRLALWFSGAYLLHMLCDAISGGLNFLQPFGIWIWATTGSIQYGGCHWM